MGNWIIAFLRLLLAVPVLFGFASVLLPSFGWLPGFDTHVGLTAWSTLFASPGILRSIFLSLCTGLLATLLSLVCAIAICASLYQNRWFLRLQQALPAALAIPHAAAALGLLFLISPSGWFSRLISPWLSGWSAPPDLLIVQDPLGLSLVLALVLKETPYLLLVLFASLAAHPGKKQFLVALTLGYRPFMAWIKVLAPMLYPLIRLPTFAVLAYAVSVVDVALILGPLSPPPLGVRLLGWLLSPDLDIRLSGYAAAVVQISTVVAACLIWLGLERLCARVQRSWLFAGGKGAFDTLWCALGRTIVVMLAGLMLFSLLGQALWSVAGFWSFPDTLPDNYTLRNWQQLAPVLPGLLTDTLLIAVISVLIAMLLTLACLEVEFRSGRRFSRNFFWFLYAPLLMPQTGFLPGLQMWLLRLGLDGSISTVVGAHLLFVLPYVFLILVDPYRHWNPQYARIAATLGSSSGRIFWRLRVPMLLSPVLIAAAVGFGVSVGQYLPTLLIGAGRVSTLTTEALALASGGNRRLIGVIALLQMLLPLLVYSLAIALPRWMSRWRKKGELA